MVIAFARLFRNRQWNRGFTLIELLIVILIVGILAAVATPLYLGYIKDAKTAEAKAVAGSLWTAVQSNAIASCDTAVTIDDAYPKAGLTAAGTTTPARWSVTPRNGTVTVACADGAITADPTVFTVTGTSDRRELHPRQPGLRRGQQSALSPAVQHRFRQLPSSTAERPPTAEATATYGRDC